MLESIKKANIKIYGVSKSKNQLYSNLEISVKGGVARFCLNVVADQPSHIQASTLDLDVYVAEFEYDGSCAKTDILKDDAEDLISNNVYPFSDLKREYQQQALLIAGYILYSCKLNKNFDLAPLIYL